MIKHTENYLSVSHEKPVTISQAFAEKVTPAMEPQKEATQGKVNQAAISILTDAELEKSLDQEIELNQQFIAREERRWFRWTKVDLTEKKILVERLAVQLAQFLKKVFDELFSLTKTRPMTPAEELELAKVAERLRKAHEVGGNADKAAGAAREVAEAKLRAKFKKQKLENLATLRTHIKEFKEWSQTPRYDGFRSLPIVNLVAWTREGAKLEAAKMRARLVTELARDVIGYPKLLRPLMKELINAKMDLLGMLKQNTLEHLATEREIREHGAELGKIR